MAGRRAEGRVFNPYGSKGGGVPKADDSLRRNVANRLGSKFRANAGGTPAPAPKPTGKPAAPAPKPAAPKPAAPAAKPEVAKAEPAPECSMQDAWAAYCEAYEKLGPRGSEEDREQQWFTIVTNSPHRRPRISAQGGCLRARDSRASCRSDLPWLLPGRAGTDARSARLVGKECKDMDWDEEEEPLDAVANGPRPGTAQVE